MKRLSAIAFTLLMLTSCSSNSDVQSESSSVETQIAPLSTDEESELITLAKKLNVSYDDFDEVYVVNSRVQKSCTENTIWVQMKVAKDGFNLEGEFISIAHESSQTSFGNPGEVIIKQQGQLYSYPVTDSYLGENIYCYGDVYDYESNPQAIYQVKDNLDNWLGHFSDGATKYRIQDSLLSGEYRDVVLTSAQRESNETAMKVLIALFNQQIEPSKLFN